MITHLQMISIFVSDMDRALAFYTEKLGFINTGAEFKDEDTHLIWLLPEAAAKENYPTQIALSASPPGDPRIGAASGLVFSSDDIEATYMELKNKGVEFTLDLVRHNYGEGEGDQEASFIDPDGNEFLLHT